MARKLNVLGIAAFVICGAAATIFHLNPHLGSLTNFGAAAFLGTAIVAAGQAIVAAVRGKNKDMRDYLTDLGVSAAALTAIGLTVLATHHNVPA